MLVDPCAIGYWSAIRHWNWTEQIPRIVYVQTTRRKSAKRSEIFGVSYEFVTVGERKFYGLVTQWRSGKPVQVTSREKTLVDCADDVARAGTVEELAKAVRSGVAEISWPTLDGYVERFPNGAVAKRLGYLFETLVPDLSTEAETVLASWRNKLSKGVAPLEPLRPRRGKIDTRWRVLVNARLG